MLTTESLEQRKVDIRLYSPQALAFLGDAVYEILVQERVVHRANIPVNKLHLQAVEQGEGFLSEGKAYAQLWNRYSPKRNWQRSNADEISARLSRRKTERCRIIAAQPVWSVCLDICIWRAKFREINELFLMIESNTLSRG